MTTIDHNPDEPVTEIELTLDLPRLLLLVAVAVLLLAAAFAVGRVTAPTSVPAAATTRSGGAPAGEEVGAGTIFDRTGERADHRQVTNEVAATGGFELDLGTVSDRTIAERRRQEVAARGITAVVVSSAGGFRVAAGPFTTRRDAELAAARLAGLIPGAVTIVSR